MPFVIPAAAIGAGVTLLVWGSKMFLNDDDSADEKAEEILSRIPDRFEEYISSISVKSSGIHISFRSNTPRDVQDEIKSNIMPG
jgi:hypothetical protein